MTGTTEAINNLLKALDDKFELGSINTRPDFKVLGCLNSKYDYGTILMSMEDYMAQLKQYEFLSPDVYKSLTKQMKWKFGQIEVWWPRYSISYKKYYLRKFLLPLRCSKSYAGLLYQIL